MILHAKGQSRVAIRRPGTQSIRRARRESHNLLLHARIRSAGRNPPCILAAVVGAIIRDGCTAIHARPCGVAVFDLTIVHRRISPQKKIIRITRRTRVWPRGKHHRCAIRGARGECRRRFGKTIRRERLRHLRAAISPHTEIESRRHRAWIPPTRERVTRIRHQPAHRLLHRCTRRRSRRDFCRCRRRAPTCGRPARLIRRAKG